MPCWKCLLVLAHFYLLRHDAKWAFLVNWQFWTTVPILLLQMFKRRFNIGAFNKETAPKKGSSSIVTFCEVSLTAVVLCMRHHQGTLAAAPPSVDKQITVPHYSDISPAMFQCSHPASCSLTPHRGDTGQWWSRGEIWSQVDWCHKSM